MFQAEPAHSKAAGKVNPMANFFRVQTSSEWTADFGVARVLIKNVLSGTFICNSVCSAFKCHGDDSFICLRACVSAVRDASAYRQLLEK